jgi:hypothetical protein
VFSEFSPRRFAGAVDMNSRGKKKGSERDPSFCYAITSMSWRRQLRSILCRRKTGATVIAKLFASLEIPQSFS